MSELQSDCVCNVSEMLAGLALVGAACEAPDTLVGLLLLSSSRVGGGELWNVKLLLPRSPATHCTAQHWTSYTLHCPPLLAVLQCGQVQSLVGESHLGCKPREAFHSPMYKAEHSTWQGRGPWRRKPDASPGWRSCSPSWWDGGTGRGRAAPTTRPTSSPRQGGMLFFLAVGEKNYIR